MTHGKVSDVSNSFSLPPINPAGHRQLTATKQSPLDAENRNFVGSLKKSELNQILEAAKKTRDDKMAASMDRFGRLRRNARKKVASRRTTTFVSPRTLTGKHMVQQQNTDFEKPNLKAAMRQADTMQQVDEPLPVAAKSSVNTEVIDLENTDISTSSTENLTATHQLPATPSMLSLQGQNTRSQPHLTSSPSKTSHHHRSSKTQHLRRSRSHARIASLPHDECTEGFSKEGPHAKSSSMEDVSSKNSSPVQKLDAKNVPDRKSTSSSKPIVRKPNYIKQNSTRQVGKGQTQSVYTGRPYVIPVARRIIQHTKSPYHQVGVVAGDRHVAKKKGPYVSSRRKQPHPRQELSMAKGEA